MKDDTKKTALDMVNTLAGVNASLKQTIALREKAGLATATTATKVSGARANGGPVQAGNTYLVGERGPELFTPERSGNIIPNGASAGQNINISVNFGGVNVQNQADANALSDLVIQKITRQLQLSKIGLTA